MAIIKNRVLRGIITLGMMVAIFNIGVNKVSAISHTFINYYGIEITDTEYINLLNLGFSEDEIYYMDEDTYLDNKDIEATLVANNKKYYKTVVPYYGASYTTEATFDEYLSHINGDELLDTSITYWKEITTTISQKNATKYRYKILIDWLNLPENRSYDVIGIGFNDDVYISSTVFFKKGWMYSDGTEGQSTGHYTSQSTSFGGSITYELPTFTIVGLAATMYYDVSKDTNDTITSLEVCGDYAHSETTVTGAQAANHFMGYGGIGFDSSVFNYFDAVPCTYAAVYGISW